MAQEYSVYKHSEGGPTQKEVIEDAKQILGLKVTKSYSPYVGQHGYTY